MSRDTLPPGAGAKLQSLALLMLGDARAAGAEAGMDPESAALTILIHALAVACADAAGLGAGPERLAQACAIAQMQLKQAAPIYAAVRRAGA